MKVEKIDWYTRDFKKADYGTNGQPWDFDGRKVIISITLDDKRVLSIERLCAVEEVGVEHHAVAMLLRGLASALERA